MEDRPTVCVVSYALGRSSEVWMWRQVVGMRRLQVWVICGVRENAGAYPAAGIQVRCLPDALGKDTKARRRMGKLRGILDGNCMAARGAELRSLEEELKRMAPDVVLCQFGTMGLRVLPVAMSLGIPIVVHFHGVDMSREVRSRAYRRSLQRWLREFSGVVVVAEYMRDWIRRHCGVEDVHLIPVGVPVAELVLGAGVGEDPCRFLAVGRLVAKKGPLELIRAFGVCRERCPGVELTMVGSGVLEAEAKALADELGLRGAVRFLGVQPFHRVMEEMHRAGAFVQHSVTAVTGDMEGWPVAIGEACASGLPVVATRHAGIPTQVIQEVSGLLVEERDWRGMGEAMARVAEDPELRIRMGLAGREHMAREYPLERQIGKLEDVLVKACSG